MKWFPQHPGLLLGLIASLASCNEPELPAEIASEMAKLSPTLDYNIDVKPILSDRCFACHGPDKNKQKGDLRLDLPVAYDKKAESGRMALVPGNWFESEVYHRITSSDPEFIMPTPESHLSLTNQEKAILVKWIQDGAQYKTHWSLVPPEKPALPQVKNKAWPKNSIDHFVLARLEEKGLSPTQEASKETLIRRLSFDLTGLPPSIAEIDAFLADKSPKAYEKVVDRLLKSPHFGERLAVDWLDAARYADTHGYQDDGLRNVYPWRDWVISAFNRNLPYDQFVTWQLAGDLLPKPTKEQILATCFLRNHPQSQEGGLIPEEYRTEYVLDRVNTFGKTFLAYSVECARCHDHKYDPISQKSFYQLSAFFNNNNESGQTPYFGESSPTLILVDSVSEVQLQRIRKQLQPLEKQAARRQDFQQDFEKWLSKARRQPQAFAQDSARLLGYFTFDEPQPVNLVAASPLAATAAKGRATKKPKPLAGVSGKAVRLDGDAGVSFTRHMNFERNQPFSISLWVKMLQGGEAGPIFSRTSGDLDAWRGYYCELNKDQTLSIKLTHAFPDNGLHLQTSQKLSPKQWHHLALVYDGSSKARGVQLYLDGKRAPLRILNDNLKQSILVAAGPEKRRGLGAFQLGRELRASLAHVAYDELRVYTRKLSGLEVRQHYSRQPVVEQLLAAPQLSAYKKSLLFDYYLLAVDPRYAKLQDRLRGIRGRENKVLTEQESVMVFKETKQPRPTFLLDRGVYDAPMERVYPGTPETILAFDERLPQNRLGLSKWLLSEKQPLFARVTVNRFWQQCFGTGIVKTVDDFGNQGELPTHAALLDYLAVRFREDKWNVKNLLKEMVMSATYRQSSVASAQNKAQDPDNRLLSRAAAYRMSAEMIRDNALAASGLLVRQIGGKSVYPYQPAGVWEALATRNAVSYTQGQGEDLYRRSLYTVWKRSSPPPAMINFDVPDRFACAVTRQKTSTPLQALVLMNDVQYLEASRVLGEQMMRQGSSPADRITYAFRALTSRKPSPQNLDLLLKFYKEELQDFSQSPGRAASMLQQGEREVDTSLAPDQLATCTVIASTLMNFDEFLIKR
ncbi:MAG: DUF1553 domain-containing protein [Adhaeribacter sp.]